MSTEPNVVLPRKPLRLWPGVTVAMLFLGFKLALPFVGVAGPPVAFLGGVVAGLLIILWWLLFSRARWVDRLAAFVLIAAGLFVTPLFLHESLADAGQGGLFYILAVPVIAVALVVWAVVTRRLADTPRRVLLVVTVFAASGVFLLLRTSGITGEGQSDLHWRWTPTPEERLLADVRGERPAAAPSTPAEASPAATEDPAATKAPAATPDARAATPPPASAPAATSEPASRRVDWPGFRGPNRDNVIAGVRIDTDWTASPPTELWRRPVGPGWSSFAVDGEYIYTQEQRGEDELVSCYRLTTGEPVWRHRDRARFYEPAGGPGPRATPVLHDGRLYTHGATGIVNALDAATGARLWSRNSATDTGAEDPGWGFASSPLIVTGSVVVAASGVLVAYDLTTGNPRWIGPRQGAGYSSPHLAVLDGVPQVLLLRGRRTTSVSPADGTVLWEHAWQPGASIVQPAVIGTRDLLINNADAMGGQGLRRLTVARSSGGWTVEERWTSRGLKPYYNDFVVHAGHAYGFDGSILSCINVDDGERQWKGGRYGHGQMLLLRDQGVLLVQSEEGDLALVKASPDQFTEIARFKAVEGKTWNHPVLVRDILLVRNGEEMAAFRLSRAPTTN